MLCRSLSQQYNATIKAGVRSNVGVSYHNYIFPANPRNRSWWIRNGNVIIITSLVTLAM